MRSREQAAEPKTRRGQPAVRTSPKRPRGRVFTRNAGIFKIMGIGDSGVPGGYSGRKHELEGR